MDAQKFLGNLADLSDMLERAPHILYGKYGVVDGIPHIVFAFNTEPATHMVHFETVVSRNLWWGEFVRIMTEMCKPPCIAKSEILFQPHYLRQIVCHSNTQAHFVILDFGNQRNLWLGFPQREKQISLYVELLQMLGPDRLEDNTWPPYWQPQ